MTSLNILLRGSAFAVALAAASTLAMAAGSGSSGGGSSGGSSDSGTQTASPKKLKCKKGEVIKTKVVDDKKVKYCAPAELGGLSDDELYEQGRQLAKEGEYGWALDVLAQIQNQNDPKVLNYIGYSHRKAGRLDVGITYYRKALALNPNFVLAREYLGEGYVAAGRVDLAKVELGEIKNRCGEWCSEYQELAKAIGTASN